MSGKQPQNAPPIPTLLREPKGRYNRGYVNDGANTNGLPYDSGSRNRTPQSSKRDLTKADQLGDGDEEVGLKQQVGLVSGVALIVGTMIGSGIFISPRGVAEGSGSVGLTLINWTLCGIISMCGALSYAELGTLIAKSGAEYPYLLNSMGPLGRCGDIPAFLFAWINMVVLRPSSIAIIILACSEYATEPFFDVCAAPIIMQKCLAVFLILLLLLVNCFSVRLATILQNLFTVAKVLALGTIIIGGFVKLGYGNTQHLASGFRGSESNAGKIAIGLYNGMWAYDGWNNLNYVTEEIINPYRNLPLAIYIALPVVTLLYVLVNISYFSAMSLTELIDSPAVAITWGNRTLGVMAWIIPVFVVISTLGAANGILFTTGRLPYVAAREGHMVELLSMVHVKRHTPLPSLVFTAIITILMVIPGQISSLIDFFSFAVWFFYGLTMVALLIMRYTRKHETRPYKVPIVLPCLVLIVSVFLVFAPIINNPRLEFLYAFIFIVAGLIFYFPFVHFKFVLPGTKGVTTFFQLLMECSPPHDEETTV